MMAGRIADETDLRRADPDFADARVSQEFDFLNALPEVVECGLAIFQQRAAVDGRFNAARTAIQQAHAERVLQIRDHLRDGRLRNSEEGGRLGHAAGLINRKQHVEIAQPDPPSDPGLPIDRLGH